MRAGNQFGKCFYCGKRIIWVRTKGGKNMPVDPEIISYKVPEIGKKAKEKIITPEGVVICADKAASNEAEGIGYISHFATCPEMEKRRK